MKSEISLPVDEKSEKQTSSNYLDSLGFVGVRDDLADMASFAGGNLSLQQAFTVFPVLEKDEKALEAFVEWAENEEITLLEEKEPALETKDFGPPSEEKLKHNLSSGDLVGVYLSEIPGILLTAQEERTLSIVPNVSCRRVYFNLARLASTNIATSALKSVLGSQPRTFLAFE